VLVRQQELLLLLLLLQMHKKLLRLHVAFLTTIRCSLTNHLLQQQHLLLLLPLQSLLLYLPATM
jgi:hypothetical protein